ncbi:MAG: biotin/lipoyl-containing protein, partial [Alphaproteobacteria bacterium]
IAFIGPTPDAIFAMGDKIESKKLAKAAGVNMVPGHLEVIKDGTEAIQIAKRVGFPVMIKASAGGGGKGMRIAHHEGEVEEGFRSATNEAKSSFGDDRVFIEKYIEEPRHIEIQVLADAHGNALYLGERECSIQRRHQKVIEEAPSPFLDDKTRAAMGEQAVALAKAVNYQSAGTVEFIVDKNRNFYFLEMNTRLQVEHPVTELVTGLDLVEQMIRVAAGEKLALKQSDVKLNGWAIEARVYAEDPFRNFLPSIGRLVRYRPPATNDYVRVDTGVYEGAEISMYYDPMIAKLVTYGANRDKAIQRMRQALDEFYIRGVNHNISFLASLMAHPRFHDGRLSTNFIAEEYKGGFTAADVATADRTLLAAVAATVHYRTALRDGTLPGQLPGRRYQPPKEWVVTLGDNNHAIPVEIEIDEGSSAGDERFGVRIDGKSLPVKSAWKPGDAMFRGWVGGKEMVVQVDRRGAFYRVFNGGIELKAQVLSKQAARLLSEMPKKIPPDLSKYILSPMPGLLVSVAVKKGQQVKAGEEVCVVEAMKMENVLRAERDGTVADVSAKPGDSLAVDQVIVEFA